jgi:lipopolysaccharide transport system ATP-binding protein
MKKREIDAKFDEIVAFSEVERFIDTPVKRSSSGMRVRLAFAVAAHLDPEILIVDEVLAVGDAEFQRKCLGKMRDVAGQGRTVLFVSHHLGSVRALCQRGLLLQQGGLAFTGATADAVDRYLDSGDSEPTIIRQEVGKVMYVEQCQILGTGNIDYQGELHFETTVKSTVTERVSLDWRIKDELNHALSFGYPHVQYGTTQLIKKGMNRFRFRIGPLPLAEGHYRISMELDKPWSQYYDRAEDIASFRITKCIVGSAGHSLKSSWGKGSLIVPFSVEPVEDGIL